MRRKRVVQSSGPASRAQRRRIIMIIGAAVHFVRVARTRALGKKPRSRRYQITRESVSSCANGFWRACKTRINAADSASFQLGREGSLPLSNPMVIDGRLTTGVFRDGQEIYLR
jgi:hypothetical protein